jgi:8-oxo-dGTP pyrophosphatase MutT (NUDIX family)
MTVIVKIHGINYMLLSLRSGRLNNPDTLITTGGSLNFPGEDQMECAIRECNEEHGLTVARSNVVYSFRDGYLYHNVAYYPDIRYMPAINGPNAQHAWEITSRRNFDDIFDNSCTLRLHQLIWAVPLVEVLTNRTEWQKACIKPICREFLKPDCVLYSLTKPV